MSLLQVQQLSHAFGGLQAIRNFNLELQHNEIVGIIGPNGAGKTTVFNLLCGVYPIQQGDILLNGQSLRHLSANEITRTGMARTFQNIRLFKTLSVLDNIRIAMPGNYHLGTALLHGGRFQRQEQLLTEHAHALLTRFNLSHHAQQPAGSLPYGLQRRLEIARALATQPKVLLLDEPACGMNPHEAEELAGLIRQIQQEQTLAILLIDHQMPFVMSLCQHITVLNFGKTIATGDPNTIRNHAAVIQSYLGEAHADHF